MLSVLVGALPGREAGQQSTCMKRGRLRSLTRGTSCERSVPQQRNRHVAYPNHRHGCNLWCSNMVCS